MKIVTITQRETGINVHLETLKPHRTKSNRMVLDTRKTVTASSIHDAVLRARYFLEGTCYAGCVNGRVTGTDDENYACPEGCKPMKEAQHG